jgi:hypothetical protein
MDDPLGSAHLNELWCSLIRIPTSVLASVEEILFAEFFDVTVQDGAHFERPKIFGPEEFGHLNNNKMFLHLKLTFNSIVSI